MKTTDTYQPGDRVTMSNIDNTDGIKWGTMLPATEGWPIRIKFDNDPLMSTTEGTRHWHGETFGRLERQPIEAGCRVRWLNPSPGYFDLNGCIVKFIETSAWSSQDIVHFTNGNSAYLKDIVRIADPEPAPVTISGYDTLSQAQRLAVMLHGKHYADNSPQWRVCEALPGVLSQIDNMTAGLVRADQVSGLQKRITELEAALAGATETAFAQARAHGELDHQINKLASFIVTDIPGEPSASEGAIDAAIRIMSEQRAAINQAARRLSKWVKDAPAGFGTDESRAWLAVNAPHMQIAFKRGDLVTWGAGQLHGRIVGPAPTVQAPFEVIITVVTNGYTQQLGMFTTPDLADMRHSPLK